MEILGFIFAIIVFCIFCGIFTRLGRIEQVLIKMAQNQGAMPEGKYGKFHNWIRQRKGE